MIEGFSYNIQYSVYSKTCLKWPLKKKTKMVFNTDYRLKQVKSIAESFCNTFDLH